MKKKKTARPSLFIGSAKESLRYAYAIQQNLQDIAEPTVWDQGTFQLTKTTIENLIRAKDKTDFAVFVFAPSDVLRLRGNNYAAVRDNVVFELGLFMGKLGRERVFIAVPNGTRRLRIPTDLAGLTTGHFEPNRGDRNHRAALAPFCNEVREEVRKRGKKVGARMEPRATKASGKKRDLEILEAQYGAQDGFVDLAAILNASIVDNKLHIQIGNYLAVNLVPNGDPCRDVPKKIAVRYRYKGNELTKTVGENGYLDLP